MAFDIYWITLVLLLPTVVLLSGRGLILRPFRRFHKTDQRDDDPIELHERDLKDKEAREFRRMFLEVYLLVMGSEWLQGPYLYALLRDEKNLDEPTVASMYVTAYIAAAASALVTGFLADRYGRRLACLVFCVVHTVSCFTVLSDSRIVLFAGRALSGVALTLLWTVFESWMVTEYNVRRLDQSSISLSRMFGLMTTSNCMAAILGGVLGHCIVLLLGSRTIPFVAGVILEATAVVLILRNWNENFGQSVDPANHHHEQPSIWARLGDRKVWIISYIGCCFEGTNFLVLFFWPGILRDAHKAAHPDEPDGVPYGVTFASFMAAMILGATFFNAVARDGQAAPGPHAGRPRPSWLSAMTASSNLLGAAVLLAGLSLALTVFVSSEIGILCSFLVFEVCNGIYVPCIAYQRGVVVNEANRAGLYGLMKVPLFAFVIAALLTSVEDPNHRKTVFIACLIALSTASLASLIGLREPSRRGTVADENAEEELGLKLVGENESDKEEEEPAEGTWFEISLMTTKREHTWRWMGWRN